MKSSSTEVAAADLRYSPSQAEGLTRLRRGKGFSYTRGGGGAVRDAATLSRIRGLAIPPAWTRVWISPDAKGHLQATGYDARGRKQYLYHRRWREMRDEAKFHRLVDFCRVLPKIRTRVAKDLSCACLCRAKVLATIVALLERAQLRVGNDEYTRENGSYGATTLRDRHAHFSGNTLELAYRAKGGIERRVRVTDRRLTRIVRSCHDLPGQRLFQYVDEAGIVHPISSCDVNAYVHDISGGPFTAKDYRTWAATLGAALLLCGIARPPSAQAQKRSVTEVLRTIAAQLGHTPTVCRKSYVHPRVILDFTTGRLATTLGRRVHRLIPKDAQQGAPLMVVDNLRAVEPLVATYLDVPQSE